MFCSKCGTKNDDGAKFCRSCGAPLGQAPAAMNTGNKTNPFANINLNNTSKSDIMAWIPTVAAAIAVICVFLPWYTISAMGMSDSENLLGMGFDFDSWSLGFNFILLSLVSIACIGVVGYCLYAALKKIPYGKFVAAAGVVLPFISLLLFKGCLKDILGSLYELASGKLGFGGWLYAICMAAYAVVSYLNEQKK